MAEPSSVQVPSSKSAPQYERRRPERTSLYRVVKENLSTFLSMTSHEDSTLRVPEFVMKELLGFLDCGLLCRGFARMTCEGCKHERLIAFSCKGRGFCPSCLGRRMAETAALLVDDVLPDAPVRHWVLSVPFELRAPLAYDRELMSETASAFSACVLRAYRRQGQGVREGGTLTVIARTASDLSLSPHLHLLSLDGVYEEGGDGSLAFVAHPGLTATEVASVLEHFVGKLRAVLTRRGYLSAEGDAQESLDDEALRDRALVACATTGAPTSTTDDKPTARRRHIPYAELMRSAGSGRKEIAMSFSFELDLRAPSSGCCVSRRAKSKRRTSSGSPSFRPQHRCQRWFDTRNFGGASNATTKNSKESSASITSKEERGKVFITTRLSAQSHTDSSPYAGRFSPGATRDGRFRWCVASCSTCSCVDSERVRSADKSSTHAHLRADHRECDQVVPEAVSVVASKSTSRPSGDKPCPVAVTSLPMRGSSHRGERRARR